MKVYLLIEITDYDCTDEEGIIGIYRYEEDAEEQKEVQEKAAVDRLKNGGSPAFNFFYEIREYEVIE